MEQISHCNKENNPPPFPLLPPTPVKSQRKHTQAQNKEGKQNLQNKPPQAHILHTYAYTTDPILYHKHTTTMISSRRCYRQHQQQHHPLPPSPPFPQTQNKKEKKEKKEVRKKFGASNMQIKSKSSAYCSRETK